MPDQNATAIAQDLEQMAGYIGDVLADPGVSLTAEQTEKLNGDSTALTSYANAIADRNALAALHAAQGDLDKIKQATSAGNAAAQRLKRQANRLNSLLAILGDAVSLGASIATGNLAGALSSATDLAAAAACAK